MPFGTFDLRSWADLRLRSTVARLASARAGKLAQTSVCGSNRRHPRTPTLTGSAAPVTILDRSSFAIWGVSMKFGAVNTLRSVKEEVRVAQACEAAGFWGLGLGDTAPRLYLDVYPTLG